MSAPDTRLLAARVAAWHNRHPLARRVTADEVAGIGVVALPFAGEAGGGEPAIEPAEPPSPAASLRERAMAGRGSAGADAAGPADRAAGPPPDAGQRAFDEVFIDGLRPRRAAAFAVRHGSDSDPSGGRWPRRDVVVAAALATATPRWRFLRTAAIESGDRRVRVLVSADDGETCVVTGQRIVSVPRLAAALGALALIATTAVLPFVDAVTPDQRVTAAAAPTAAVVPPPPASTPAGPAVAPAASAAATASAPMTPVVPAVIAAASAPPADEAPPAPLPTVATPASAPVAAPSADIRPRLDPEVARRARAESAAARAAAAALPAPAATTPADEPPAAASDAPAAGKAFALVARQTRTRAASLVMLGLMQSTASSDASPGTRTDVLPSSEGYRASWWPFSRRSDAERAQQRLAAVGLPVDIVEF